MAQGVALYGMLRLWVYLVPLWLARLPDGLVVVCSSPYSFPSRNHKEDRLSVTNIRCARLKMLNQMLPWDTPHKLLFRVLLLCVILTSLSIILTPLVISFRASYNRNKDARPISFPPCPNLTTVYNHITRTYRQALRTSSPRAHVKRFSHETWSNPKLTIAKHVSISASVVKLQHVNCQDIVNGSRDNPQRVPNATFPAGIPICDAMYTRLTADCALFKKYRGYITSPLTAEENSFPLAYSMIVYKDSEMVERLLRAIYRPQNYYCLHVDGKSRASFFRAISDIANCFTNVVIASERINVTWGTFSVLSPELLCMAELWRFPDWRYFLTLTGQEFPLKTNHEIVKILKAWKGANDILTTVAHAKKSRWKNTVPPPGIVPVKGSVHITVNRDFVDYILHNDTAKAILEWTKQTEIPDETFFAVLGANPQLGISGTYTGDLPLLFQAKQLFANKFLLGEDRVVVGCLEEKIFNDTRDEYLGTKMFNTSYYEELDVVSKQVT